MKNTATVIIEKNIEDIFDFLDGSLENLQKIDPKIIENIPLNITENRIGSTYKQKYKEGKRVQSYVCTVTDYLNESNQKFFEMQFELLKIFDITVSYKLKFINESKTEVTYTSINIPLKWYVKIMFKLQSTKRGDRFVLNHLEKIKSVMETKS